MKNKLTNEDEKFPCDVSGWERIGKKRGYWHFFEKKIREKTIDECVEGLKRTLNDQQESQELMEKIQDHQFCFVCGKAYTNNSQVLACIEALQSLKTTPLTKSDDE